MRRAFFSLAFILLIIGCGSGDGPTEPEGPDITGRYELVSVLGQPLPTHHERETGDISFKDGHIELRRNDSFTYDFTFTTETEFGIRKDRVLHAGTYIFENGVVHLHLSNGGESSAQLVGPTELKFDWTKSGPGWDMRFVKD